MIPESVMVKLLGAYRTDESSRSSLFFSQDRVEKLARYITVEGFKAMQKENAPEPVVLQAACSVLTGYIQRNKGIELLENGPGSIACFPISEEGTVTGVMLPDVAQALVGFAERLSNEK